MQFQSSLLLLLLFFLIATLVPPATPHSAPRLPNHPRVRVSSESGPEEPEPEDALVPASLLLEELQQTNGQLTNLTRHHDGDIFHTTGE